MAALEKDDDEPKVDLPATDKEASSSTSSGPATNTLPSVPPMTKMQASLLTTLSDMSIRSEVEECMNIMLMDVETAFYLRQELELQATKYAMETATKHHQATILEANAEREARESEHSGLADQMVQEVMSLSRELEELLQWKRDHEHKVEEYGGLVAKLAQTEEDLQIAKEQAKHVAESKPEKVDDSKDSKPKEEAPPAAEGSLPETPIENQKPAASPPASDVDVPSLTEEEPISETTPAAAVVVAAVAAAPVAPPVDMQEDAKPAAEESSSAAEPAAAAVTLDADEPEDEVPGLVEVDVEILMTIFGFLDAMDILNMAQINLAMYSKIDNIFGISEDGQSPPQPTPSPAPASQAPVLPPTPASKPEPSPVSGSSSPPQAGSAAASGPIIGNRLFSMLQPARSGPGAKKPAQALNPSVAQSMASKLSDTEIAAILSMTDKLNKMDKEVSILRNEKEAMVAKLDGTEAVKQFLINKVRDVEMKLAQSRDDEIKVTQQIASDQEVIAFLDSRVQELERQTETLTKDKSRAQSELDTIKVQTSKKITMLSDMLKYEREKLKDEVGEWKATKKVLVKEVKSCRAQILALQAERDGLREQNEMLKRAIVSTGKGSARTTSPLR